jgi:hypothetical protein
VNKQSLLSVFFTAILIGGLVLASALRFGTVQASTEVTGIIRSDTTWSQANSPYNLTGVVLVQNGANLIIESGTTVNFNGYSIDVNGTLTAKGSSSNPIKMNNGAVNLMSSSSNWNEQARSGCIIENTIFTPITDIKGTPTNGISINECSPKIAYNTNITLDIYGGSPSIIQNRILRVLLYYGTPQISSNNIHYLYLGGGSPVIAFNRIDEGISGSFSNDCGCQPIIWNNDISIVGGTGDAVINLCNSTGEAIIAHNRITGIPRSEPRYSGNNWIENITYTPSYGIIVRSNAKIFNNIISGCLTASISIWGDNRDLSVQIKNNTIDWLIEIYGKVHAWITQNNMVNLALWPGPEPGETAGFSPAASNDVNATFNWWGTTDLSHIEDVVYDGAHYRGLGTVTYTPILTQPNTQATPDQNAPIPTPKPEQTPATSPTPTPNQEQQQAEFATIIGVAIVVAVIIVAVGAGLLFYFRKRSNAKTDKHSETAQSST